MNYILCPKCGKEVKNLMVNVCKTCYIEKYRLAELPEVIEIDICSKCGSFLIGGNGHIVELLMMLSLKNRGFIVDTRYG